MTAATQNQIHSTGQTTFATSVIVPVAETIVLERLDRARPHNFLGVEFFSDATGTPVAASGGSVQVTVTTWANPQGTDAIPSDTIVASSLETLSWDANTKSVSVVPTGIVGATHWRVNLVANAS